MSKHNRLSQLDWSGQRNGLKSAREGDESWATTNMKKVEQGISKHPAAWLVLAVALGVAIGWWLKRT
jgi:hypothetical protein